MLITRNYMHPFRGIDSESFYAQPEFIWMNGTSVCAKLRNIYMFLDTCFKYDII
jgi:hypothetical protein